MKKVLYSVILTVCALLAVSCKDEKRSHILKVYNWGDYIDEDLIGEFEEWYQEQTGEEIAIVYQTFDINETMLSKIEKGHEDYDVVCPSEYIIERMLREDLLLPLDKNFGETPNYIDSCVAPFIIDCFNRINGNGKNANDYSVGYMWGTTGLLYNTSYVDDADASTWGILSNPKYAGRIFVKDAPRDVYGPILMYLRQDEIKSGKVTIEELMYDSSDKSIEDVENYLISVKEAILGWEADFGKEQMTQEKGYVNFTWSGDAQWAIVEAEEIGVHLKYSVPKEGSIVWFDGWVIPKYAKNVKAARYFINFLCRPDVAIRNMDYIGYVSAVASDEVLEAMADDSFEALDLSYFFGPEADSVCANPVVYPDRSTVMKCAMMHDWGDDTSKLLEMWSRVKGDAATPFTYFVIFTTLALLIISEIFKRLHKIMRRRNRMK